ncbi:MAG TPA: methylcrotonoyl-CoA carboxylase, partial [Woeseiaceae bacterium]|nr:methylcrotonoyl-CoA carboxylase [Woeseiaceae bacterium]
MTIIRTKIKTTSEEFEKNASVNMNLARELRQIRARVAQGGNERSRERHLSRGKLLPRDRVR